MFFTCLFLLAGTSLFAQLSVGDVRQTWYTRQGTIEEAVLSVRPKGVYVECGLYLTFSARGVTFNTNGDSLEVVLTFSLPEGAAVHDSWLWLGENDIIKAHILDRWTASTIYEGIVHRRRDPSILYKNSATQYQLRVFPMDNEGTRKVKITWLQQVSFLHNKSVLSLPISILKTSKNPVDLQLLVWSDDRFGAPGYDASTTAVFETASDTSGGQFYRSTLTPTMYANEINLQFESPLRNGYYLGTFEDGDEKYYQLAVSPSTFFPGEDHRKVAVLFDYATSANAPTTAQVLEKAKIALLNNLSPKDSFNLFFSNFTIGRYADHWVPAHPDSIIQAFASLNNPISSYSNLQPLMAAGINWIQEIGAGGEIMLVSNSNQYSSLSAANALLQDLLATLNPNIPFYTLDFNESFTTYFYANGTFYYANSYLLNILSIETGGYYVKTIQTQSLSRAFESLFANLGELVETFSMEPDADNGFCYGRYQVGSSGNLVNLRRPYVQIGKYVGNAPFQLDIDGVYQGQPWLNELTISESDIQASDSLVREMWYGRHIQGLENELATTSSINTIIFNSLSERILSKYTAFLCLEEASWLCDDCEDETQYTGTEDLAAADSTLTAFPNPFMSRTNITIRSSGIYDPHTAFEIYDLRGSLVRRFELGDFSGEKRFEWDGNTLEGSSAAPGLYVGILHQGGRHRVIKLVKMNRP